jgi:hypothetical protein
MAQEGACGLEGVVDELTELLLLLAHAAEHLSVDEV